MSFIDILYTILIRPLEIFFEILYSVVYGTVDHAGLAIICMSLAVNFLILPLYQRADAMQAEEHEVENKLKIWVTHIKKTFRGDERMMMLQTYYKQNNYKPTYVLKSSVPLFLEIPFFVAAFHFLSNLSILNGVSFGPIMNLAEPDALLKLSGCSINLLPILMTVINIISSYIYAKDLSKKSKIQLYLMAVVFLLLLYDSPSGLVFYWTLNNIFSLFKNIFYKLINPKFILCLLSNIISTVIIVSGLIMNPEIFLQKRIGLIFLILLELPLPLYFITKNKNLKKNIFSKQEKYLFYLTTGFLMLLTGVLIPSAVINASPQEFINMATLVNPSSYVFSSFLVAAGVFILWFGIFFTLFNEQMKKIFTMLLCMISGVSFVNYMFFGKGLGTISSNLKYDITPSFSGAEILMNMFVSVFIVLLMFLMWKKSKKILIYIHTCVGLAIMVMSMTNLYRIHQVVTPKLEELHMDEEDETVIPLSRNGKNVIVLMMDRAISSHVPYIFKEKPELLNQFAGFTYYPNTISYGAFTNFGAPPIYGGYEYTPEEMNRRDQESLADKHNEALKVMPAIFYEDNFDVTICDPPYAGYEWLSDLSIYEDYPEIHGFLTKGRYNESSEELEELTYKQLSRNFFCYSIFRIAPTVLKPTFYTDGSYNDLNSSVDMMYASRKQICKGISIATGIRQTFMDNYNVLTKLKEIVKFREDDKNTLALLCNDTTHEPMILQRPEYLPSFYVDNTEYDQNNDELYNINGRKMKMEDENQVKHYHANMATMIQLGLFMDYLRENDVYDNTRIIIVSDHGRNLNQFDDMLIENGNEAIDTMFLNAFLMVKDFNSNTYEIDNSFMTNGDVPTIAMKNLIHNPINPFTNKEVTNQAKEGKQKILYSMEWDINTNNGNTFLPGTWISVHDNIFEIDNWEVMK